MTRTRGQSGRVDDAPRDEARVYARDPSNARDLLEQELLISVHVIEERVPPPDRTETKIPDPALGIEPSKAIEHKPKAGRDLDRHHREIAQKD